MQCEGWTTTFGRCQNEAIEEVKIDNTSATRWFCQRCKVEENSRGSDNVMRYELQELVKTNFDYYGLQKFFQKHRTKFFAKARTINAEDVGTYAIFPYGLTCSCVPAEHSCFECGDDHGSKFYITKDLEFLRVSFSK